MSVTANNSQSKTGRFRAFRRRHTHFAVPEEAVSAVVDWSAPAPLPHAPDAIRGVISVHGRMLTVVDMSLLPQNISSEEIDVPLLVIVLRGDEQLALAADEVEGTIESLAFDYTDQTERTGLSMRTCNYDGGELAVIDVKQIFHDAMQGRERRHRRF